VGSTIRPAAFCGIPGFKPTYDRIPVGGVIPLAPSVDHVGLFCRDLPGMALAASILCRGWRGVGPVPAPVLGVPEGPYLQRASHEGLARFRDAMARLAGFGVEIRPVKVMANFEEIAWRHNRLVAAEAASVHAVWFSRYGERYRPETRGLIERGKGVSSVELETYRESRIRLRDSLQEIMDREGIFAWSAPSTVGPAPVGIHATGEAIMNLPWTHAGLPVLSLPSGVNADGLPMGLQLVGRWMDDESLLAGAAFIQEALRNER
jgi:Asp-tRNA(Asn)/Glu-tRNA(Gln) amidotransferase A subunit family amidase